MVNSHAAKCSASYISRFVTRLSPFVPGNRFWYTLRIGEREETKGDEAAFVLNYVASIVWKFHFLWGHRLFPLNCLATKFELTFVASGSFIWIYDVFSGRGRDDDVVLYEIYPGATRATFRISHFEHRISTLSSRRRRVFLMEFISFRHA